MLQFLITWFLVNDFGNITRTQSQWITAGNRQEALDIAQSLYPGGTEFRFCAIRKSSEDNGYAQCMDWQDLWA